MRANLVFVFLAGVFFIKSGWAASPRLERSNDPALIRKERDEYLKKEAERKKEARRIESLAIAEQGKFAKEIAHGPFTSTQEFLNHFTLKKYYPEVREGRAVSPEEYAKITKVAETFFSELKKRTPEFMALGPSSAEVHVILEAPFQFPDLSLHDHVPSTRKPWLRTAKRFLGRLKFWDVTTLPDIFDNMDYIVKAYIPRIKTMDDYLEFVSYRVPGAYEFEAFKRDVISASIFKAAELGDAKMAWLDAVVFENEHVINMDQVTSWTRLLFEVRNLVPESKRSDETLTAVAIRSLTSEYLHVRAYDEMEANANNDLLKILINAFDNNNGSNENDHLSPNKETVKEYTQFLQRGLMKFLKARVNAGFQLSATGEEVAALAKIGSEVGFEVNTGDEAAQKVNFQIVEISRVK